MSLNAILKLSAVLCALALVSTGYAADSAGDEITQEETASTEASARPEYSTALKEKYGLTDEQIQKMRDQGMNNSQIAISAQLAKSSGKTVEEVTQMRLEQKLGWGKIAKELGVHPAEIGKGVSSLRREMKEEKREAKREERKERREMKREERKERKAERAERKEKMKEKQGKG